MKSERAVELSRLHVKKQSLVENFVDWNNFNATQRKKYENNITALFSNIDICTNTKCSIDHLTNLDNAYDALVGSFHHATNEFKMIREKKFKVIPSRFWKEIRSRTVTSQKVSGAVDGRDTDTGIANVFYDKFSSISGKCNSLRPINNHRTFSNLSNRVNRKELFSLSQITEAIKQINTSIGIDGIHSNHLKYLPTNCIRLLVKFFNACIYT